MSWNDMVNCFGDATMMSVFHTLNAEFVHHHCQTCAVDPRDLFALVRGFCNRTRLHSASNISAIKIELKTRLNASTSSGNDDAAATLRIPIYSGRVFRLEAGHRSDLKPAGVLEVGVFVWVSPSGIKVPRRSTGEADAGQERTDHATDTTDAAACP
ncbi:hypothetical protein [Bradyrhizobium sp. RT6a]|uniref:hypothetical protein n=1 Tax=Bradyrhizobium sp. RT6a TaxID=3156381 RepID=UPI00339186F5